ncbi:ABC transporter CDR4 [Fusarium avenaceum]|nr:ABC transporter CDR4 [Fusarium avenaceum]
MLEPLPIEPAPSTTAVVPSNVHDIDTSERESSSTEIVFETPEQQIHSLARQATSQSLRANPTSLFSGSSDARLNPDSPGFNAREWTKAFYNARTKALGGTSTATAGLAFKNLNVYGNAPSANYQPTIGDAAYAALDLMSHLIGKKKANRIDILRDVEGVVNSGEMVCVLGPPGSGCSTLLKTISGETYGFQVHSDSVLNYQGLSADEIRTRYRGEAIYTAETDNHFPKLTVGETLYFAARARCPREIKEEFKHEYAVHTRNVVMAMLGISHTMNTRVGNDYIRGVSGGERKRVSIAEAVLSYSPWQCWDNSTRGLDSANAIELCRTLRTQSEVFGNCAFVAIYQAPQEAYDLFDKVSVLYEGRQIFFGKTTEAKGYFENLGYMCPDQQTTPDFLTSMTSAAERTVRPDWKGKTPPRSAEEFYQAWKESEHRQLLLNKIHQFEAEYPIGGKHSESFQASRAIQKSKSQRTKSPFTLSIRSQLSLNLWRAWRLLVSDPWMTITLLLTNFFEAIIVASIFYNLSPDSSSIEKRNLLIFFTIMINGLGSLLEVLTLYEKRKVIEKHGRYALYHPSVEAVSSIVMDLPYKLVNSLIVNSTLYFMCNLRREPGPFFFFLLMNTILTITMSNMFRLIASVTTTLSQALAPGAIVLLAVAIYSGFAIPQGYINEWIGWLRWINPIFYVFESLALNEFVGRQFPCSSFLPSGQGYDSVPANATVCDMEGSLAGETFVDGARYIRVAYRFVNSHRWRNFGILIALAIFFLICHLVSVEKITSERSKGEVLIFPRKVLQKKAKQGNDEESGGSGTRSTLEKTATQSERVGGIARQTSIFHWQNICYELDIKGEKRTILDHVDGWVKPGTLTALMGVSGAGKTTLLDALACRITMGVVTGQALVDGLPRDLSFQRKTGYATQQDLHLHTATVREALSFSALLRQPDSYSRQEKLDYVDEVIRLVDLTDCADAVIGTLGEGLNVEQRKRLTIGVELAARPQLLLFLDEPTSGLDSQTSWAICDLMEKLTNNGQAILCTIHQPSAALFQRFDRLLLLAKGGRTVYFGPIGRNSKVLIDYFQRNGADLFDRGDGVHRNPAEYMLEMIGAAPNSKQTDKDWPATWRSSPEYQEVHQELARLGSVHTSKKAESTPGGPAQSSQHHNEFAAGLGSQIHLVTKRVFQQYWRTPGYILSKTVLTAGSALFIGLSQVNAEMTARGLFTQMLLIFIFLIIFGQIIEQAMPMFVSQRTLYEARERPAKAYSWVAFLFGTMIVELAWNSLMAVFSFLFWYFPLGLYHNAEHTDSVHSRGITVFLNIWVFFMFSSTFGSMIIAGIDTAEVAGGVVNLFFIMMFAFAGVLAAPSQLPGFWIFMYRVNPFTYIVEALVATCLADAPVHCQDNELVQFEAPSGLTCGEYVEDFISSAGGYLVDRNTSSCSFCPVSESNVFLETTGLGFDHRWRNFGLVWAYCVFNICATAGLYWLMRVPKSRGRNKA